jgi:hypothetical protein
VEVRLGDEAPEESWSRGARNLHERILSSGGRSEFHLVPDAGHLLIGRQASELAERIHAFLEFV